MRPARTSSSSSGMYWRAGATPPLMPMFFQNSVLYWNSIEGDANRSDHPAGPDDAGAGRDGLVGADALEGSVHASSVSESQHCRDSVVPTFLDDVGATELLCHGLAGGVAA